MAEKIRQIGTINRSSKTLQMVLVGVMTAVICVVAPFSIPLPFSPVPISFTMLILYLACYAMGMKRATLSCLLYLLLGAFGLPVFSGFTGGLAKLTGPTGGYLFGFILLSLVCGCFVDKAYEKELETAKKTNVYRIAMAVGGMLLGLFLCYLFGTIWFMIVTDTPFQAASIGSVLGMCVIPFLPGDALKIVAAVLVGMPLRHTLKANQLV